MIRAAALPRDPVALLRDCGGRLVRCVLASDTELTDALLDLAAGDQTEWSLEQWQALLTELESDNMTVSEFLDLYS